MIVLVITVVVLIILSSITIYEINVSSTEKQIRKMNEDIEVLRDKCILYYNKTGEVPKTNRSIGIFDPEITYWEIDIGKLDITSLNFGHGYGEQGQLELNKSDVYVINNNFEIVYLRGIKSKGVNYYQSKDDKNQVDDLNKTTIKVIAEEGGTVEGDRPEEGKKCYIGDLITLKAVPGKITVNGTDYNYEFVGWYLDGELQSTNAEYTIAVRGDATYIAKFDLECTIVYCSDGSAIVNTGTTLNKNSGYKNNTNITKVIIGSGVTEIGSETFYGCTSLEEVVFSGDVLTLGQSSFYGCTSLEEIDTNNVENMNGTVFWNCTNLKKIIAPKIKTIGAYPFHTCRSLEEVELGSIGNHVESMSGQIFVNCTQNALTIKIYIDTSNNTTRLTGEPWGATDATIEYYDAGSGNLVNIIWGTKYKGNTEIALTQLPDSDLITEIKANAFNGCTNLALTSLPENLISIGSNAFKGCTSLKIRDIYMASDGLKNTAIFDGCTGLEEINLHNAEIIGPQTFIRCTKLKTCKGEYVKTVSSYAFHSCTSLTYIELGSIGNPVEEINSNTFWSCGQNNLTMKLYIADNTKNLAGEPWQASRARIEYYNAKNGNLENIIWGITYKGNTEITWTELPDSNKITKITANAFDGCTNLELTSLPPNTESIGANAFYNCKKIAITSIPEKVSTINQSTFGECKFISNIDLKNVETIGATAFIRCTNLTSVTAPKVKNVESYAFHTCTSLREIQLGSVNNPVASISTNGNAFYSCSQSNLTLKIYIDTSNGATSLSGQPWGATNATIEYYDAETGTKIN